MSALTAVQITHDEYDPSNWFTQLSRTCARFGLDKAVLNTFKEVQL